MFTMNSLTAKHWAETSPLADFETLLLFVDFVVLTHCWDAVLTDKASAILFIQPRAERSFELPDPCIDGGVKCS